MLCMNLLTAYHHLSTFTVMTVRCSGMVHGSQSYSLDFTNCMVIMKFHTQVTFRALYKERLS